MSGDDRPARHTHGVLAGVGDGAVRVGLATAVLACVALGLSALSGLVVPLPDAPAAMPSPAAAAAPASAPTASVPVPLALPGVLPAGPDPAPAPQGQAGVAPAVEVSTQEGYARWADGVSRSTGVPARALQAYGHAHAVLAQAQPGCRITWVTLAGIARIESNHGGFGGRTLGADGRPSQPIIGIPLDGSPGVRAIGDTDGGALDADTVWDRAVGPFQFIPTTWARWRSDGDGDGRADPQDIDDAAVAAGRYLCANGRDLGTGDGWQSAVLSYNNSMEYVRDVYAAAQGYADSVG